MYVVWIDKPHLYVKTNPKIILNLFRQVLNLLTFIVKMFINKLVVPNPRITFLPLFYRNLFPLTDYLNRLVKAMQLNFTLTNATQAHI